ncbi:TetR/AcrR family transcriptional regulator [Nocardia sp. NBC_01388]|uniref:TetR/AcrR family transcriptional regulator n=1 Tax=Nocardia sp. NBC_01388 TaxID=2903596 RepID=UPI0032569CB9
MPGPTTTELLWGIEQKPKRGPKPSLTLERIVAEAIALADAEGLGNLSMQRLAERLGCAKMALYRYVPGKAELTAVMLDAALGRPPERGAEIPGPAENWRDYLNRYTETAFERFGAHHWGLELAVGIRPLGPNEMSWLEAGLEALDGSGLTASEQMDSVVLLFGHVRGLAQTLGPSHGLDMEEDLVKELGAVLIEHGHRYPHVAEALAEQAARPDGDTGRNQALRFGTDRILDGIGALIASRK